ncbi:hypothetical protein BST22_17405 [Mycolicibacterium chubuense]|nr:hypothetical protein BST22_17405 [Mycolicibacterium chubuense]
MSTAPASVAGSVGATEVTRARAEVGSGSKDVTDAESSTGIEDCVMTEWWGVGVMAGAARQAAETSATRGLPMDECIRSPSKGV